VNRNEDLEDQEFSSPENGKGFEEGGVESYSPSPGGESSSVVEEIVEQKIVNLKSDQGSEDPQATNNFRENYLNVNGEDYINREEYGSEP